MTLAKSRARTLALDGFVVLRGAIELDLIAQLRSSVATEISLAKQGTDRLTRCEAGWFSPNGALFADQKGDELTQVQITYRTSAAMIHAALNTQVLDVLEERLGDNIELFGEGQAFVKMPGEMSAKHMHQDDAFFSHESLTQHAALLYLHTTDETNGALQFVPGSHLTGALLHSDSTSHSVSSSLPPDKVVRVDGGPGDVVLFHGLTLHGSDSNHSSEPRIVAVNRFRRAGDRVLASRVTAAGAEVRHAEAGQEGILVRGHQSLDDASGWAWPIHQQRLFPV